MAHTRKLINQPGASITVKPAAALASPNRFVTFDSDSMSVVLSSAADNPCGVILQTFAAGELGEAIAHGTVLVESGATDIAPGDFVMPGGTADGRALKLTGAVPCSGRCVAVIGTLAAGDLISVDLDQRKSLGA